MHSELLLKGIGGVALKVAEDLSIEESVGDLLSFTPGDDVREVVPALYGLEDILRETTPDLEMPFVHLSQDHTVPVSLSAIREPETGALWLILRDVSEEALLRQALMQQRNALALAQNDLVQARDEALAANRAKTTFLANVSHELRTPLQVVIGGASILTKADKKPLENAQVIEFATDIHDSGLLLLELVDDLIDLSRAEIGELSLYEEWFSMGEVAQRVVSLARGLPMVGQTVINMKVSPELDQFYGDSRRCKQIMLNLLSNAMKAVAPEGVIDLHIQRDKTGGLLLEVKDNGPGMNEAQCAVALEPFGQPNPDLRAKGSGLGLTIVKRLAALHEADFQIQTAPGEGLMAQIRFPAERMKSA